jgi:hypothetical protein
VTRLTHRRSRAQNRFVGQIGVALAIVVVLPGCGPMHQITYPDTGGGHYGGEPTNDTPLNTMKRFEQTCEFQDLPKYGILFASDFRFTFSSSADMDLALQYGDHWRKDDEIQSAHHLFEGFTNTLGEAIPPASRISMNLNGVQVITDPEHADSAAYYQKVVVDSVMLTVQLPGTPESTTYDINARHEFYLVRGDAAVLDAGQETRTDRWYIRRWDDLAVGAGTTATIVAGPTPTYPITWGRLKAGYR